MVGEEDDPLEDEADFMADRIMRMPEQNFIQRECSHCKEEENLYRKPEESFIQAKRNGEGVIASESVCNGISATKGNGASMDASTLSFMQNRFDADFNNVKIHTDGEAIKMNRELNAKAFTVDQEIYFNKGEYQPRTSSGRHLLAHELTHVLQKSGSINKKSDEVPGQTNYVEDMAGTLSGLENDVSQNCGEYRLKRLWRLSDREQLRILKAIKRMLELYAEKYKEWKASPTPEKEGGVKLMQVSVSHNLERAGLGDLIGLDAVDHNLRLMDCLIAQLTLEIFREITNSPDPERRLKK